MGIGKNVQMLRERQGLTFAAVANAVGTDAQAISQMEKRGSKTSNYAAQLALFFGVSLEDLLSDDFNVEKALERPIPAAPLQAPFLLQWLAPDEAEILSLFRACGEAERGTILSIARSLPKAIQAEILRGN